ncbi:MAG: InlB B-repeat-containing protein [Clostridia bacterium]|nr:InlB B-repeat-containing protein [Clostridia bacterium]
MKKFKSLLSGLLVAVLLLSVVPLGTLTVSAATVTSATFNIKLQSFKSNKYGHNSTYRDNPDLTGGYQCFGFANELALYIFGSYPTNSMSGATVNSNWKITYGGSAVDSLCVGDIVRYHYHSIFITAIDGNNIYYCQANSPSGTNLVTYDNCISRSALKSKVSDQLTSGTNKSGWVAHCKDNNIVPSNDCKCSTSYKGSYKCTTSSLDLTIRSGHSTSSSVVGYIPSGATVYVSKASGTSANDWAHVEYNGKTGYVSMQYLSKIVQPNYNWVLHKLVSDSAYGNSLDQGIQGEYYYFCYKIMDQNSGKMLNDCVSKTYTVKMTLYNPDGTQRYSITRNNTDDSWFSVTCQQAGTYKCVYVLSGDFNGTYTKEFAVAANPPKVSASTKSVTLDINKSKTINMWRTGYYNGDISFRWQANNSNVSCTWGEWNDGVLPLVIQAQKPGTTELTLSIIDSNSKRVLHSIPVTVTVQAPVLSVYYHANGGTVGSNYKLNSNIICNSDGSKRVHNWTYNKSQADGLVNASTFGLTKTGYTFVGWGTSPSGGTVFDQNDTTLLPEKINGNLKNGNCSTTLYAVWQPETYTIQYNANGGNGAPAKQIKTYGTALKLSNTIPQKEGYVFKGWSSDSAATTVHYAAGETYTNNEDDTLYAVWQPETYTIQYDANGGNGAPAKQIKTYGTALKLSNTIPQKEGYVFKGWSSDSAATTVHYVAGATYTNNEDDTLYAVWEEEKQNDAIFGDLDGDKQVTASDALMVLKCIVGKLQLSSIQKLAVKVFGYDITSAFALTILKIVVGKV